MAQRAHDNGGRCTARKKVGAVGGEINPESLAEDSTMPLSGDQIKRRHLK
jgi:hypothetical protein